jgi:hypothetical protein
LANKKIELEVGINDNGDLRRLSKEAKKAAADTDTLAKSQGKAADGTERFNKQQKGVAGATSNSTKAFSKMTTGISGGLVPAYATLAANIFAISAAFGALKRVAAFDQLVEGFNRTANASGRSAEIVVGNLKQITDGAISSEQAFQAAAVGFSAGFSTTEIEGLTKVAKGASLALGRDMGDAMDRLIRGTAKIEPEILDELGIFVRLDDAVRDYAESMGKTAGQLTQTERRQAFLNTTLTQGALKFANVSESVDVNPYDRLSASFDALSKTLIRIFDVVLRPFVEFFAGSTTAMLGGLILFSSTITSAMFPALDKLGGKFARTAQAAKEAADDANKAQKEIVAASELKVKESTGVSKKSKFHKIQAKLIRGEKVSVLELQAAEKSLQKSVDIRYNRASKLSGEARDIKEAEIKVIEKQTLAVRALIDAEEGRSENILKASKATKVAEREGKVGKTVDSIKGKGLMEGLGFKEAREGLADYKKDLPEIRQEVNDLINRKGFLGKIMKKSAVFSRVASVGVRLFGTAIVNAIPVIGQIIMVLGFVITGLKALWSAISKPSEAMKQMTTIVEGMDEKMQQLKETNSKLVGTYTAVLIAEESRANKTSALTDEQLASAVATGKQFAAVTAYGNKLKVNSGIVSEFTGVLGSMIEEAKEEPTALQVISEFAVFGPLRSLGEVLSSIGETLAEWATYTFDGVTDLLKTIAGFYGKTLDFVYGEGTSQTLVDAAVDAVGSIGESIDQKWSEMQLKTNTENFIRNQVQAFSMLKEANSDLAGAIEKELGGSFEDFVNNTVKGAKTQEEFENQMGVVQGRLVQISQKYKEGASAVLDFGENVAVGQKAMSEFGKKFFQQNPFNELKDQVVQSQSAVQALKDSMADSDEATFADAINLAIKSGKLNLEEFGLTAEQVSAEGAEAFNPLISKIQEVATETDTAKSTIATLQAGIKDLQKQAQNKLVGDLFTDQSNMLRTFGKFEQSLGQKIMRNKQIYDDQRAHNTLMDTKKKALIDAEFKLKELELELLLMKEGITDKEKLNIQAQIKALDDLKAAQKAEVTTATTGAQGDAKTAFFKRQQSNTGASGFDPAGSGNAVVDAINNANEKFATYDENLDRVYLTMEQAFQTIDEKGNKTFSNFGRQVAFASSVLTPFLEDLAKLGPRGEVAASLGEGMLIIAGSFGNLADTIQTVFKGKSIDSFETFKEAWKGLAGKTQVKAQIMAAAFSAVANSIGALANTVAAAARNRVAGIDNEIAAEKERDGVSKASQAKMVKLEAKKEQVKKKAFETDKKLRIAQAIMSTAAGVASALSGGVLTAWMAPIIMAMGMAQVAIIAGTSYQGKGAGGGSGGIKELNMGSRNNTVDLAQGNSASGELGYMRGEQGQGTGATNFKPGSAFTGAKYRASGGETAGFMVGEQGPELFIPDRSGRIAPADETAAMAPMTSNVNFNISAVDAAGVEDVLVRQKGHIIRMIREAANEHGQPFLEDISDGSYTS